MTNPNNNTEFSRYTYQADMYRALLSTKTNSSRETRQAKLEWIRNQIKLRPEVEEVELNIEIDELDECQFF